MHFDRISTSAQGRQCVLGWKETAKQCLLNSVYCKKWYKFNLWHFKIFTTGRIMSEKLNDRILQRTDYAEIKENVFLLL